MSGADDARLDDAGFWQATVKAHVAGTTRTATAAFQVLGDFDIPSPGDRTPRSVQPLAGDTAVPVKAIDSRAGPEAPIPDPELHSITVADAIAARRPVMVAVSTPTYCQSRFCGPITDSFQALAARYGDRMAFVHLEVWRDFEGRELNASASEWIFPPGTDDAREPWVFVVGPDGVVVERFDNVATDADLEQAAERVLSP